METIDGRDHRCAPAGTGPYPSVRSRVLSRERELTLRFDCDRLKLYWADPLMQFHVQNSQLQSDRGFHGHCRVMTHYIGFAPARRSFRVGWKGWFWVARTAGSLGMSRKERRVAERDKTYVEPTVLDLF